MSAVLDDYGVPIEDYTPTGDAPAWGSLDAGGGADPVDMYVPVLARAVASISDSWNPADAEDASMGAAMGGKLAEGAKTESGGLMSWMRNLFGFSETEKGKADFAKAAVPAAATIASGLIAGAGAGYAAAQKRKIEEQMANTASRVADSTIALNRSKTSQDLSGLKFTPGSGGLLNTPYAPAALTPVRTRG